MEFAYLASPTMMTPSLYVGKSGNVAHATASMIYHKPLLRQRGYETHERPKDPIEYDGQGDLTP